MKLTLDFHPDAVGREQVLLVATDWAGYQDVLKQLDDARRHYRSTYDNGLLEIIVPGNIHEAVKKAVARLLELYGASRGLNICAMGSATIKSELRAKGLEPDEWYTIGRLPDPDSTRTITDEDIITPDLAIEIDVTSSSMAREPVYAALGVKELWVWRENRFQVHSLSGSSYVVSPKSVVLPDLDLNVLSDHLVRSLRVNHSGLVAAEYLKYLQRA